MSETIDNRIPDLFDNSPATKGKQDQIVNKLDEVIASLGGGGTGVTTATSTAVTVGNTSTSVLAANADRLSAVIVNDSDEVIYLALGATAVANSGIRLNANGGAYEITSANLYTGAISAICASGGKKLTVVEF